MEELQSFLGIINYLTRFSLMTAEVCVLLRKLMLVKYEWSWNGSYQSLYGKAKKFIGRDTCMEFYDALKPLYLETDALAVGLGASL